MTSEMVSFLNARSWTPTCASAWQAALMWTGKKSAVIGSCANEVKYEKAWQPRSARTNCNSSSNPHIFHLSPWGQHFQLTGSISYSRQDDQIALKCRDFGRTGELETASRQELASELLEWDWKGKKSKQMDFGGEGRSLSACLDNICSSSSSKAALPSGNNHHVTLKRTEIIFCSLLNAQSEPHLHDFLCSRWLADWIIAEISWTAGVPNKVLGSGLDFAAGEVGWQQTWSPDPVFSRETSISKYQLRVIEG